MRRHFSGMIMGGLALVWEGPRQGVALFTHLYGIRFLTSSGAIVCLTLTDTVFVFFRGRANIT